VVSRNLLIAVAAACAALALPAPAAAHTDAGWQLSLQWPAQGTITSPFGRDGARWHPGLDIGILQSLDVRAAADGVVVLAGEEPGFDGYGSIVVVQHRFGYMSLYAHLSRPLVRPGEQVRTKQLIGIAGCTGWCTGTHLHFEVRHGGVPIDPTFLMVG
jgi:murein DD-endopeptidase MepM/ murein hydrolase activator NlpD